MAEEKLILVEADATNAVGFLVDDIEDLVYEERQSGPGTVQILSLELTENRSVKFTGAEATTVYTTIKDSFSEGGADASPQPIEITQASILDQWELLDDLQAALSSEAGGTFMRVGTDGVPLEVDISGLILDHGDDLSGLGDDDHLHYHTDVRALTWLGTRSTDDLPEGSSLYYTTERAQDDVMGNVIDTATVDFTYDDGAGTLKADVLAGGVDHGGLAGLGDDDHSIYAYLDGRTGGQTLVGGTAPGEDLIFQSTANGTRGSIFFGLAQVSVYDEANESWGFGGAADVEFVVKVHGPTSLVHTATTADEHGIEIAADAAGYGDVKAAHIDYVTGVVEAGEDEGIILINIDETLATGGDIFGIEILATDGSAEIYGLKTGVQIGPIHQDAGVFGDPALSTNDTPSTDVPAMTDGNTGTTTAIFVADDDYIIIGDAAAFEELELILTTPSNKNIKPTFWYSTAGTDQFTQFTPVDGTCGCLQTGVIAWDQSDLVGHVADDVTGNFDIKIIRTRNNIPGDTPVLGYAKTAATTEFIWDKDGNVNINDLSIAGTASGIDHGGLDGLGDDDHTQYLLASGARALAGDLSFGDNNITNVSSIELDLIRADAANGSITIELDNAAGADLLVGNNNALVVEGDTDFVGIGTVPLQPFEVNGAMRLLPTTFTPAASGKGMEWFYNSADDRAYLQVYDRTGSAFKPVRFRASAFTFDDGNATFGGTLTVNGNQAGATDHVFDDYDDMELLEKWRAGGKGLPFEIGDMLNRDRLLRDTIIQQHGAMNELEARVSQLEAA
jgi:hypothetical protein